MNLFEVIILAITQGLTEFIPVSSSAHLSLIPKFFGWSEQSTSFDLILHGGTLLALLIFFRRKLWVYIEAFPKNDEKNKRMAIKILWASIPAIIAAFIIVVINKFTNDALDTILKSTGVEVFFLVLIGVLMILSDFYFRKNSKTIHDISFLHSHVIGLAQATALIRGVSRSGISILTGLTMGLHRKHAAEFGFLIGIPVLVFGFAYQIFDFATSGVSGEDFTALIIGFLVSFVTGYLAIKFLLNYLGEHGLKIFGIYRIILAIIVLLTLK